MLTTTPLRDPTKDYLGRAQPAHSARLSKRMFHLLRHGDERGDYGHDPVRVTSAIVMAAARAGHDLEQLLRMLEDERNVGGDWFRTRCEHDGRARTARTIARRLDKAVGAVRPQLADATDARIALAEMGQAALTRWTDPSASTRTKSYLAHITVATKAGRLTYTASMRQLAELANVHRDVVRRRNAELRTQGLLRSVEPARGGRATTWTLTRRQRAEVDPVVASLSRTPTGSTLHPAFRFGTGLDGRLWNTLEPDEPSTTRQLADHLGVRVQTIRRKLNALASHDLTRRDDDGAWRQTGNTALLDEIAERTGMADRSRRQRERHKAERIEHHAHLSARRDTQVDP